MLADAQATVANERGYDTWAALVEAVEGAPLDRWEPPRWGPVLSRAMEQARTRGHEVCGSVHVLLALLEPPQPTVVSQVLAELGVSADDVAARLAPDPGEPPESIGTRTEYTLLDRFATGIAVAQGDTRVRDEHVLLALLYADHSMGGSFVTWAGIDPDEAYDALARRGVAVPPRRPGVVPTPLAPAGPHVYFLWSDAHAVSAAQRERYAPGSRMIGFNHSLWKPRYCYLTAEDDIDLAEMVRGAVADPSTVEVVPNDEAIEREAAADRRRA
jgi:hypothetical protein